MMRLSMVLLAVLQSALGVEGPLPAPVAPPGLEVELRAVGSRTTFRLSEPVPVEVSFRSSTPSTYRIEIADGWSVAPTTDRFTVAPGRSVIDRQVWWLPAFTCCDSRRPLLRATPAVYEYELTDLLRFTEPGEYRVQFSTRRIFTATRAGRTDSSDLVVRSNVLTIHVIEDDPKWLDEMLSTALAGVTAEPSASERRALPRLPSQGSLVKPTVSDAMRRYIAATRQLRLLDTPAAVSARVARIVMPPVEEARFIEAKVGGMIPVDSSVAYSSRPDVVAAALEARASAPEFGITRGYFELWHKVVLERDYPRLVRLGRSDGPRVPETGGAAGVLTKRQLLNIVQRLNAAKVGVAAELTATTVRRVDQELARAEQAVLRD